MNEANAQSTEATSAKRTGRVTLAGGAVMLGTMMIAAAGVAAAQNAAGPVPQPTDGSLTLHGVTLYGIVDVGVQYDSHSAPFSDYYPATSSDVVQKYSNGSQWGATSSNMSQSRVGLQGIEALGVGDWNGIFRLETFFNPTSGNISDGLKSLTQNNGRSLDTQTINLDSSVAGQIFQQSFVGLSSVTFGSVTFGRQNTLFADGIGKYDPQGAAQAFSYIGLSGTPAGGGATQDRRLDNSLKYVNVINGFHVGAEYKFNNASGAAYTAYQFQLGAELYGASVDAYFSKVRDAIAASQLNAVQLAGLPALGLSPDKTVAATVSDNTMFGLLGLYNAGVWKFYAGYEHVMYANPESPLAVGFDDIGGYKLGAVNNTAYKNHKILQVYWAGVKYTMLSKLDLTASFYGLSQNSYATGANTGCSSNVSGSCSGHEIVASFSADYRFTKRFDVYAGAMYTSVYDGMASGFIQTNNINPTIGFRFRF